MATRYFETRAGAVAEVACLVGLVETIMWAVPFTRNPPFAYLAMVGMITLLLVTCHLRDGVPGREMGFRVDNLLRVLGVYVLPFGITIAILVAVGLAFGSLSFGPRFVGMLLGVPAWALLQQYMLLAFAQRRFRVIFGPGKAPVLASTAMFGILHLPNPTLTVACLAAGFVWAWQYERSPNLFANALTHTIGSAFLANSLPPLLLKNMVVGYHYFLR